VLNVNEHAKYIEKTYSGGLSGYTASQRKRYEDALKKGDTDLIKRLEADAKRVGYSLTNSSSNKNTSNKSNTNNKNNISTKTNEHAEYIEKAYSGGLSGYTASQRKRYEDALKRGDTDLIKRLEADAKRVGYSLTDSFNQNINNKNVTANEHAEYIEKTYPGGLSNYVASQRKRYEDALKRGDTDLIKRLEADAKRVGYSLEFSPINLNTGMYQEIQMPTTGNIIPTFSFPEYQKAKYPYLSLNEALERVKKLYNPAYQLEQLRANEAFSQEFRNLPYYLNVKGQAFSGLREAAERGLSQEHAKALAAAGFQHQQLLNQAAQQLYGQSQQEAQQAEQQDYARYLNARDRAYQMYRDYIGDQKYLSEREYQKLRDAIEDIWKQREYERQKDLDEFNKELKMKGLNLDQSQLNLAWAQYNLAKDKFNYQKELDKLEKEQGIKTNYETIAQLAINLAQQDPRVKNAIASGEEMSAEDFWKIVQEYRNQLLGSISLGSFMEERDNTMYDHGTAR
jgi:hypothetical protein